MDFHCHSSQGCLVGAVLCACYRHMDGDPGRVDTSPQPPFPLPTKLFVAMPLDLEVRVFRQGHPLCLCRMYSPELISQSVFDDKK